MTSSTDFSIVNTLFGKSMAASMSKYPLYNASALYDTSIANTLNPEDGDVLTWDPLLLQWNASPGIPGPPATYDAQFNLVAGPPTILPGAATANLIMGYIEEPLSVANENTIMLGTRTGEVTLNADNTIAVGTNAGLLNQGANAIAVGHTTASTNQGHVSVAVGFEAASLNQSEEAIAIGYRAGNTAQGRRCVALGDRAGNLNQGTRSVAIGTTAGNANQESDSVAVGTNAGLTSQRSQAVAIGPSSGSLSQGFRAVAIGSSSGITNQSDNAVAIGYSSGYSSQGNAAVAVGWRAGDTSQAQSAVAIGTQSGFTQQGASAIAIGANAGYTNQGLYSIAIGSQAGETNLPAQSIVLNATGLALSPNTVGVYMAPVNASNDALNVLTYNTITKQVQYSSLHTAVRNRGYFTWFNAGGYTVGTVFPTSGTVQDAVISDVNGSVSTTVRITFEHAMQDTNYTLGTSVQLTGIDRPVSPIAWRIISTTQADVLLYNAADALENIRIHIDASQL